MWRFATEFFIFYPEIPSVLFLSFPKQLVWDEERRLYRSLLLFLISNALFLLIENMVGVVYLVYFASEWEGLVSLFL